MDELFWQQSWGDKQALLSAIEDPAARRFAEINYGPWDRLAGDQPFIERHGPKPLGARFYPEDMTKAEFEAWEQQGKDGLMMPAPRRREQLRYNPTAQRTGPNWRRRRNCCARPRTCRETRSSPTTCGCGPTLCLRTISSPRTWPGWT
jgi:hypothetical protein